MERSGILGSPTAVEIKPQRGRAKTAVGKGVISIYKNAITN